MFLWLLSRAVEVFLIGLLCMGFLITFVTLVAIWIEVFLYMCIDGMKLYEPRRTGLYGWIKDRLYKMNNYIKRCHGRLIRNAISNIEPK